MTLTYLLVLARVGDYHLGLLGRRAAYLNIRVSALLVVGVVSPGPPLGRSQLLATSLPPGCVGRQCVSRSEIQDLVSSRIRAPSLMQERGCNRENKRDLHTFLCSPTARYRIARQALYGKYPISIFMSDDATRISAYLLESCTASSKDPRWSTPRLA